MSKKVELKFLVSISIFIIYFSVLESDNVTISSISARLQEVYLDPNVWDKLDKLYLQFLKKNPSLPSLAVLLSILWVIQLWLQSDALRPEKVTIFIQWYEIWGWWEDQMFVIFISYPGIEKKIIIYIFISKSRVRSVKDFLVTPTQ